MLPFAPFDPSRIFALSSSGDPSKTSVTKGYFNFKCRLNWVVAASDSECFCSHIRLSISILLLRLSPCFHCIKQALTCFFRNTTMSLKTKASLMEHKACGIWKPQVPKAWHGVTNLAEGGSTVPNLHPLSAAFTHQLPDTKKNWELCTVFLR